MEFSVADLLSFPESMKVTPGGYNRALYTGHVSLNLCDSWQQRASFFGQGVVSLTHNPCLHVECLAAIAC